MIGGPLRLGDSSDRVAQMQRRLNLAGYRLAIDGEFGPYTQAAVAAFLSAHGLGGNGSLVSPRALAVLAVEAQTPSPRPRQIPPTEPGLARRDHDAISRGLCADDDHGVDALGVTNDAHAFARIVCSRTTGTPLSIGTFGPWGSGKSFFLSQLQDRIDWRCRALTRVAADHQRNGDRAAADDLHARWHSRIAQVDFNAWHFAEPNLWASLVTRIFDQLAAILNPEESIEDTRSRLLARVSEGQQQRDLASSKLDTAEQTLAEALAERQRREAELEQLREQLGVVEAAAPVTDADPKDDASDVLRVRSPWAALTITLRWIWARGKWTRVGIIAGLVLVVIAIVLGILWQLDVIDLHPAIVFVTGIVGVIDGVVTTATTWWKVIKPKIAQAKKTYAAVTKAHGDAKTFVSDAARDLMEPGARAVAVARKGYDEAEVMHERARTASALANEELAAARRQLRELEGGRRFYAFIRDRDESSDYRQHLGLVSMIREDLAQLDRIVRQVEREGPGDSAPPPISRIVIYIDDLDRCEPQRVVEVLQAINLLLATPLFVVVLAADVRWLQRSIDLYYDRLLVSPTPHDDEPERGRPLARRYLEKVVQIPFVLQPMDADGFASLIDHVVAPRHPDPTPDITAAPTEPEPSQPDTDAQLDPAQLVLAPTEAERAEMATDAALTLGSDEIELAKRLYTVIDTPRLAKTLVNTYRMLRASLDGGSIEPYLDSDAYRAALTLLAIAIGRSQDAPELFALLRQTPAAALGDALKTERWQPLRSAIEHAGTDRLPISLLRQWMPRVARFSFSLSIQPPNNPA